MMFFEGGLHMYYVQSSHQQWRSQTYESGGGATFLKDTFYIYPSPPAMADFSSDLYESKIRYLNKVGGTRPPPIPPPWLRHC